MKKRLIFILLFISVNIFGQDKIGIFDNHSDVGAVLHNGTAMYESASGTYQLSGSGTNIWGKQDEFQFVWKKMKGNFLLQTSGKLLGKGTDPHRKYGWMIRNSLDTNSPMVCAALHGDGLTSLQYRSEIGGEVTQVKSEITATDVVQLERRGNKYIMSVAHFGEDFAVTEIKDIALADEVFVGIFICSHNKDIVEKVNFQNVRIIKPTKDNFVPYKEYIGSHLELLNIEDGNRQIIHSEKGSIQAPNWSPNDKYLIYNADGKIFQMNFKDKAITQINTGDILKNNNDHVISFDGKMLGLSSSSSKPEYGSIIYTVPITGGKPKQITPTGPSYLHSWSPDGKFLIFTGKRNDDFDIYKVPANGGEEVNLTKSQGLDDGSEYSRDGKYIYFNSTRSGLMQIWRMNADGSNPTQLTNDKLNNWFPHPSPDGKWIIYIAFPNDIKPDEHPFYKHVYLKIMPIEGGKPKTIAYLYGGQGSINTPSWSPDSKKVAFVSNSDSIE